MGFLVPPAYSYCSGGHGAPSTTRSSKLPCNGLRSTRGSGELISVSVAVVSVSGSESHSVLLHVDCFGMVARDKATNLGMFCVHADDNFSLHSSTKVSREDVGFRLMCASAHALTACLLSTSASLALHCQVPVTSR